MLGKYHKTRFFRVEHPEFVLFYKKDLSAYSIVNSNMYSQLAFHEMNPDTKAHLNVGPYFFLRSPNEHAAKKNLAIEDSDWDDWRNSVLKNEPCVTYGIDYNKLVKLNRSLGCLWRHRRPGPSEDPYLREYVSSLKNFNILHHFCCCQDIQKIKEWFFDVDENRFLSKYGFKISEYRGYGIHGLRQSLIDCRKPTYEINTYEIEEFLKLENKEIK
jgi:hypothetical protein